MVMSIVWLILLILSVFTSLLTDSAASLGTAALRGAQEGITLALSLAGAICLWSGMEKVMEQSGLAEKLTALFRPLLGRLFPQAFQDETARQSLCGNFTANLLGLGNAATPLGIAAVRRMQTISGSRDASDEMCRLIVLNTASVQLIPSTVGALRASLGSAHAFEILPAVWITSLLSVSAGLLAARVLEGQWQR